MLLIQLLLLPLLLYIIWLCLYSLLFGAPYAAIGKKRLVAMLRLANTTKADRAVDIGSGDGRIVIAFAKAGANADGYEINPLLYMYSKYLIKKNRIGRATIFLKDLWKVDFSSYDIVTLYGNFPMMGRLEKKLQGELRTGARVISNHFQFPNWQPTKVEDDVYLYIK